MTRTLDNHTHWIEMKKPVTERECRESVLPCVVCEARILPGDRYRVLTTVGGEAVSLLHFGCERRKWDR